MNNKTKRQYLGNYEIILHHDSIGWRVIKIPFAPGCYFGETLGCFRDDYNRAENFFDNYINNNS